MPHELLARPHTLEFLRITGKKNRRLYQGDDISLQHMCLAHGHSLDMMRDNLKQYFSSTWRTKQLGGITIIYHILKRINTDTYLNFTT